MSRFALFLVIALTAPFAAAQDEKAPAADDYPQLMAQWKQHLAKFAELRARFQTDTGDKDALQAEARETMKQAHDLLEPLTRAAAKKYISAPNEDAELTDFLVGAINNFIVTDDFEMAAAISKVLVKYQCDAPQLDYLAGMAFFATNDFDEAGKHLQAAKDKQAINQQGLRNLGMIDRYKEAWAKEQAIRKAEEKAGDLPRVKLETTQGDIMLELFENEAPNTVANFISLVESNFYDGLKFHRVIPGFMAQTGDPNGDGSGGPGYTIHDECRQANHRNHFRGSLSMAKTAEPDSGGSQFYITFVPTPHLDGKHTVFGRVADRESMRVLSKLQRTEGLRGTPNPPDEIIKATVISKRNHPYQPITRQQ